MPYNASTSWKEKLATLVSGRQQEKKKCLISLNYMGHMWITYIKNSECILCNKVVAFPQVHSIKGKRKLK